MLEWYFIPCQQQTSKTVTWWDPEFIPKKFILWVVKQCSQYWYSTLVLEDNHPGSKVLMGIHQDHGFFFLQTISLFSTQAPWLYWHNPNRAQSHLLFFRCPQISMTSSYCWKQCIHIYWATASTSSPLQFNWTLWCRGGIVGTPSAKGGHLCQPWIGHKILTNQKAFQHTIPNTSHHPLIGSHSTSHGKQRLLSQKD